MSASLSDTSDSPSPTTKGLWRQFRALGTLPGTDALRLALMRLFDLQETLDSNETGLKDLISRVALLTEGILKSPAEVSTSDLQTDDDLVKLSRVVNEISSWTEKIQKVGVGRPGNGAAITEELMRYNRKLDDVYFQVHLRVALDIRRALGEPHSQKTLLPDVISSMDVPLVELPPKPIFVYGRQQQVRFVSEALLGNLPAHIAVLGCGGMGKTTFVVYLLHEEPVVAHFGRNRIFVNCDGLTSVDAIVAAMLSLLSVRASSGPTPLQALIIYLRALGPRVLLVLDNLESAWDTPQRDAVEAFLTHLCNIPTLALLTTMRGARTPTGQRWLSFPPLEKLCLEDARSLFMAISNDNHDGKLDELLEDLDGLPLAITIMASLGKRTSGYTPSKLLQLYHTEQTSMLETGINTRLSSLEVSIMVSINCGTMQANPEALEMLKLLSLLPDGVRDEDLESTFPQLGRRQVAARVLHAVALATYVDGSTRVLVPIRAFMRKKYPPDGAHLLHLQRHYVVLASSSKGYPDMTKALIENLSSQMVNLQSVLAHALENSLEDAALLDAILHVSFFSCSVYAGDCTLMLRAFISLHSAKAAAEGESNLHGGPSTVHRAVPHNNNHACAGPTHEEHSHNSDFDLQSRVARGTFLLGITLQKRCQYNEAIKLVDQAKSIYTVLGRRKDVADCLCRTATILRQQTEYDQAMAVLYQAKATYADIGDRTGAAYCLWSLAENLRMQFQYDQAIGLLNEAQMAYTDADDRAGIALCLWGLGNIHLTQGMYDQATDLLKKCQTIHEDVGNQMGVAESLWSLADLLRRQDECEQAEPLLQKALAISVNVGQRHFSARCMRDLGTILGLQSKYDEATTLLKEAEATYWDFNDPWGAARCLWGLGDNLRRQGEYGQATGLLNKAKPMFAGFNDKMGLGRCLWSLGEILRVEGENDRAASRLNEAKAEFVSVGSRLDVASCTTSLAQTRQAEGDVEGARVLFAEARTLFEGLQNAKRLRWCQEQLDNVSVAEAGPERQNDEHRILLDEVDTAREVQGASDGETGCQEQCEELEELRTGKKTEQDLQSESHIVQQDSVPPCVRRKGWRIRWFALRSLLKSVR